MKSILIDIYVFVILVVIVLIDNSIVVVEWEFVSLDGFIGIFLSDIGNVVDVFGNDYCMEVGVVIEMEV